MSCGFAYTTSYILTPGQPSPGMSYLPASLHCLTTNELVRAIHRTRRPNFTRLALSCSSLALQHRYGNINPLSIGYACRPRLRSRLTQGGLAWPWNPWSSGGRVSHPSFATHACILTRVASTASFHCRFTRHTTLPYPSMRLNHEGLAMHECQSFGGVLEPRYIIGAESLDQ